MSNNDYFDLGLSADLAMWKRTSIQRRRLLRLGAAGIATLLAAGCSAASNAARPATSTSTSASAPTSTSLSAATSTTASSATAVSAGSSSSAAACVSEIPSETAGPYPADGSRASNQTLNAMSRTGIIRSDIRTSLGTQHVAAGVPATIELTLINTNNNCAPLAGYAVYLWHCNREGQYSLYSQGATDEDYLRGVQAADTSGKVVFQSIFPACYMGRWPHVHFEIYPSLDTATSAANVVHTSQLALPEDICKTVYNGADGYSASVRNLSQISLSTDNVFSDGTGLQMAAVTGNLNDGYAIKLAVGVAA